MLEKRCAINFSKDYQLLEKIIVQDQDSPQKKKTQNSARFHFSDIIGSDPDLKNAVRIAKMSSNSPSPIMIYGETGTGKELFAQSIHNHSSRKKKPFIPVNCAAIPGNLLEGILFGTSKGAFTGAIDKSGLFEHANGAATAGNYPGGCIENGPVLQDVCGLHHAAAFKGIERRIK